MSKIKSILIKEIKEIIKEYGFFYVGEVEADNSPVFNVIGGILFLGEVLHLNAVEVVAYHKDIDIDSSLQPYEKFTLQNIKLILELAKQYKQMKENEEK